MSDDDRIWQTTRDFQMAAGRRDGSPFLDRETADYDCTPDLYSCTMTILLHEIHSNYGA